MKRSGSPKRTTGLKRSPLARGTSRLKRTRLNPVSKRRRDERGPRADVVAQVIARDKVCQFFPRLNQWASLARGEEYLDRGEGICGLPFCDDGPLTAHEPGHSRNVGRLNPDEAMAMCWRHNGALEDATGWLREAAESCGLLLRANGLPYRKRERPDAT